MTPANKHIRWIRNRFWNLKFKLHHGLQQMMFAKASWWFQPIWKILVKLEIFPK